MPHALIGYAGSTLKAAELYAETFPGEQMTVLVDYYGQEVTDALAVCNRFPDAAQDGRLAVRRSEEHTSELQSLMRISYAVFCLKKKKPTNIRRTATLQSASCISSKTHTQTCNITRN